MYNSYQEFYNNFRWTIPGNFNIADYICNNHLGNNNTALIYENENGEVYTYTFENLDSLSNQLANYYQYLNVNLGDRIGLLLSQQPETIISHIAGFKIGAVNIPLFTLFGPEALAYRLHNSEAKVVIVEENNLDKVIEIWKDLPHLEWILCIGNASYDNKRIISFYSAIEQSSNKFETVSNSADDPALIIYTSGTTGPPKGALHAHRVLIGHLPGIQASHNFFPQSGDLFWTPADWAWIGGLIDVLFPSLYYGIPVLACRFKKFGPEAALELMARHQVRNVFLPPTALKMMRNVSSADLFRKVNLRTLACGGESLGEEMLDWGEKTFGVQINEFYGQTEANLIVSNCTQIMPPRPNSMGKPVPGHEVAVIDKHGQPVETGELGEIGVKAGDPVMFLGYWKNEEATRRKFINEWLLTGDMAVVDEDGYLYFKGRSDDVITCAGYRIGPAEVEDCLLKHPAVALSAVVGKPDSLRGEIVKAFIKLNENYTPNDDLKDDIKRFVKTKLAAHEYPREIDFIDDIPLTVTGKVKRKELRDTDKS